MILWRYLSYPLLWLFVFNSIFILVGKTTHVDRMEAMEQDKTVGMSQSVLDKGRPRIQVSEYHGHDSKVYLSLVL